MFNDNSVPALIAPQPTVLGQQQQKEAVAFLNLELEDAEGKLYKLPRGVALMMENVLERTMFKHFKENPEIVFKIRGTIRENIKVDTLDIKF